MKKRKLLPLYIVTSNRMKLELEKKYWELLTEGANPTKQEVNKFLLLCYNFVEGHKNWQREFETNTTINNNRKTVKTYDRTISRLFRNYLKPD
jgi:hypothetical protein